MRFSLFSFMLSTTFLMGCPKKNVPDPTDGPNPRYEFVTGVRLLETPDKKTGFYDYETALNHFVTATQLDPNFVQAYKNAGWVSEQMGDLSGATGYYQQAYNVNGSKDNLFAFTDLLRANGNSAEAVEHLQKYFDANKKEKEVQYALVETKTEAGLYDEANKDVEQILLYAPKDVRAYQLLSRNYHAQKNYKMSLLCAEKANEIADGDPGILNNMGVTYLEMENEPAAIDSFLSALEKDPEHLEANLNLGFVSLASGNYGLAKEKFEAALKKNPENIDVKVGLAVAFRGLGEEKEAEKIYKKLLKEKPNAQIIYFNAATLYEKYFKKYKDAKNILQDYRTRNPNDLSVEERIARVEKSEAEALERKRLEEQRKREEAERKKRQKEEFAVLKQEYEAADKDYQALTSCAEAEEKLMEIQMYLEQVKELIDTNDFETAGDAMPFVREAQAGLNELKEPCGIGGGEQVEEIREEDMIDETPQEGEPQEGEPQEEESQEEEPQEETSE